LPSPFSSCFDTGGRSFGTSGGASCCTGVSTTNHSPAHRAAERRDLVTSILVWEPRSPFASQPSAAAPSWIRIPVTRTEYNTRKGNGFEWKIWSTVCGLFDSGTCVSCGCVVDLRIKVLCLFREYNTRSTSYFSFVGRVSSICSSGGLGSGLLTA
jgi:hypothetical protein